MLPYSLKVYVTSVVVLYVKFLATTGLQAIKTFQAGCRSPEDTGHVLAKGKPQNYGLTGNNDDAATKKAKEVEVRWKRIVLNDLESIPLALFVFGAGVLVEAREDVEATAIIAYTVSRILHTVAYANAWQPHRGYCWRVGVVSILAGGVNALIAAYRL